MNAMTTDLQDLVCDRCGGAGIEKHVHADPYGLTRTASGCPGPRDRVKHVTVRVWASPVADDNWPHNVYLDPAKVVAAGLRLDCPVHESGTRWLHSTHCYEWEKVRGALMKPCELRLVRLEVIGEVVT